MKKLIIPILLLPVLLVGCGRVTEGALNEVLQKDPSFAKLLNAKRGISAKASEAKKDFEKKKKAVRQEIRSLEENLQKEKNSTDKRILALKEEMAPRIDALKARLVRKRSEYKLKKTELKTSLAKLANIKKLLVRKKDLALSGDEISVWNKRVAKLEREIASTRKLLLELQSQTRLLKIEIKILQE